MKINDKWGYGCKSVSSEEIWRIMTPVPVFRGRSHHAVQQFLRVMKLTTFIMFIALLQVTAATKAQITINAKQESLRNVLKSISKQSGYDFIYSVQDLKDLKATNIRLNNASITEALEATLGNQPVVYEVSEKTVMVKKRDEKVVIDRIAGFATIDVTGYVFDENNQPLSNVTIRVKDGKGSTSTNQQGEFLLRNVDEGAMLQISYMGYVSQEVAAVKNLGVVKLKLSDNKLDEVQIMAYGKTSRRLAISNIGTVREEEIAKNPINNPLLVLQGRVSGIRIEQQNGLPGGAIKVIIQGPVSLGKQPNPLYVIDGIPYTSTLFPTNSILGNDSRGQDGATPTSNPLSLINPNDIESIDVLKDANATSIYGSRASGGAILITTKKGKAGAARIDVNLQQGFSNNIRHMNLLNTNEYLEMRREAYMNDKLPVPNKNFSLNQRDAGNYDLTTWDENKNTDWQKVLLGGTGGYQDFNGSVSGGTGNTQILFGATYHKEVSIFSKDLDLKSGAAHMNFNTKTANGKFNFQADFKYLTNLNRLPQVDLTTLALNLAPNTPDLYLPDGSLNWALNADGTSQFGNVHPLGILKYAKNDISSTNLMSNGVFGYNIINGLNFKTTFGYNQQLQKATSYSTLDLYEPSVRDYVYRQASYSNGVISQWQLEPQLSYNSNLFGGTLDALLGSTINTQHTNWNNLGAYGFKNDAELKDISMALNIVRGSQGIDSKYRYAAIFTLLNYNYNNKYLISLSARRDGSSRFGDENKLHNFGSVGFGWIFTEEKWIKEKFNWLSFGKLRFSYGTTGNDQIQNYQYLSLYSPSVVLPYQGSATSLPNGLPNPYLQWEESRKLNMGLNLGFLKDRIILELDYFRTRSSNQLVNYNLPITTGFSAITMNLPAKLQNHGFELNAEASIVKSSNFSWTTRLNWTIFKDKLLSYPGLDQSSLSTRYKIGESINRSAYRKMIGVDPMTGIYQYEDANGLPTNNTNYMPVFINLTPTFTGGINNTISVKSFSLDFLLQFVKQQARDVLFGQPSTLPGNFYSAGTGNQPKEVLERWRVPGDVTDVQQFTVNNSAAGDAFNNSFNSDKIFTNASFLRVKNVALGWTIPPIFSKRVGMASLKLTMIGQNLFTLTRYKGLDPETGSMSLPPLRTISFGIQANFQ